VTSYGYDTPSQLTGITYTLGNNPPGNLSYAYDNDGRRSSATGTFARTGLPLAMNQTAYNANNQLTTWGTASLFYDLNGNMTSDGTHSYTWDARDRLKQIDLGNTASFTYDPFGRRATKSNVGTSTTFLYDGANAVQEVIGGTNTANSLSGGIDEVFQRTDTAGARSFLSDALGSTLALADSSGTLQTQYTFDPFGNTTTSGSATTNSFAYTGRELDAGNLYFYRARYYNPTLQRFISEDPIGFAGGINFYAYVHDSPTSLVDPSGSTSQTNWNYFWDWVLGGSFPNRNYDPNSIETQEMKNSMAGQFMRDQFIKNGCRPLRVPYGTFQAYWDTAANPFTANWNDTSFEVGGFAGPSGVTNNGNGTAAFDIYNTSGTHSFFLHLVPDRTSPDGPMSNINQHFHWTEPIPNGKCGCK